MAFIDLFAGLGGFHLALTRLGHDCVFASEIDDTLRDVYEKNFGIRPVGDIRAVDVRDIPNHDILCAGFPCQPFSKAGSQDGFKDPELGDLYKYILKIIRRKTPKYVILENVPNLKRHDSGKTWQILKQLLEDAGYEVRIHELSPHQFGIPQIRNRVYIVASTARLDGFALPTHEPQPSQISIKSVLDTFPHGSRPLSPQIVHCLAVWQDFLRRIPRTEKIPHPIWSMEFGASYPFETETPWVSPIRELQQYRGSHGVDLSSAQTHDEAMKLLPSHARSRQRRFPAWKVQFIKKNREFYEEHKCWLDDWIPKIREFPSSFQKLEWNCQSETDRRLSRYVLQLRASGVRVKRPTTAPSLVAMTSTQVPIITWERRYMTPLECQRLQSMEELKFIPASASKAYEALGNAVNVEVAMRVAEELVGNARLICNCVDVPEMQLLTR